MKKKMFRQLNVALEEGIYDAVRKASEKESQRTGYPITMLDWVRRAIRLQLEGGAK